MVRVDQVKTGVFYAAVWQSPVQCAFGSSTVSVSLLHLLPSLPNITTKFRIYSILTLCNFCKRTLGSSQKRDHLSRVIFRRPSRHRVGYCNMSALFRNLIFRIYILIIAHIVHRKNRYYTYKFCLYLAHLFSPSSPMIRDIDRIGRKPIFRYRATAEVQTNRTLVSYFLRRMRGPVRCAI